MTLEKYASSPRTIDFSWAKDTDTIFWDGDQCLFYEPFDEFADQCWESSFQTAVKFLSVTYDEARCLSQQSWNKYHSGYDFLMYEYGFDIKEVVHVWHENLDESFVPKASQEFQEKMQRAAKNNILITHGSFSWANRLIKQSNLKDFFPDKNIIAFENMYPQKKSSHTSPYLKGAEITGCDLSKTPMIEDTQKNLLKAKEIGLKTIAVHQPIGTAQEIYTDYMMQTPEMFLDAIVAEKNSNHFKFQ